MKKNVLHILAVTAILGLAGLNAQAQSEIHSSVDVAPVPLKTPPPEYPRELRDQQVSGLVTVVVVIDETGAVESAEIGKFSNVAFREPSLDAVQKWRFKPGQKDGKPVKTKVTIPLRFNVA